MISRMATEQSVAANDDMEPSASGASYTISESIAHDAKLDEGLRAPIPIHDDLDDTTLLSDNELEAFVKRKKYSGKLSSIPPNLKYIYQRLSGKSTWNKTIYKQAQKIIPKHAKITLTHPNHPSHPTLTTLPQIASNQLQQDISYSDAVMYNNDDDNQQEPSPFPPFGVKNTVTPAPSSGNLLTSIDSDIEDEPSIVSNPNDTPIKDKRKNTLTFLASSSPVPTSTPPTKDGIVRKSSASLSKPLTVTINVNNKSNLKSVNLNDDNKDKDDNKANANANANANTISQPVKDCSMRELMKYVSSLTSEVINLQQELYVKDIMIKNLYLRSNEFNHISFPQLLIERIHITTHSSIASINKSMKPKHHHHKKHKNTLSNDESISSGKYTTTTTTTNASGKSNNKMNKTPKMSKKKVKLMDDVKKKILVNLEIFTRWLSRSNISSSVKKGLVTMRDGDISDVDDYLSNQMWNEWCNSQTKYTMSGLDKMKKDDVYKQVSSYMYHERVGLVRIEILRGKKYKRYRRIEKRFEQLRMIIPELPRGDTYHIMVKVHNPSCSLWGPLSNMVSIKVPLKFVDDDDYTDYTDNDNDNQIKTTKNNKTKTGSNKNTKNAKNNKNNKNKNNKSNKNTKNAKISKNILKKSKNKQKK